MRAPRTSPLSIRLVVHVSSPAAATSPQNCGSGTSGTQSVRNASVGERRAACIDGQGGDGTDDQGGTPPRRRGRRRLRGLGVGPRTRERSSRDVEPSGDNPWRCTSAWRCSPISTATAARRWLVRARPQRTRSTTGDQTCGGDAKIGAFVLWVHRSITPIIDAWDAPAPRLHLRDRIMRVAKVHSTI